MIVKRHVCKASHPRAFRRCVNLPTDRLDLVVNEYVSNKIEEQKHGLSVLFAHANGLPKELYEPFFKFLLTLLKMEGVPVRSIWAPDVAHQGESGVCNEDKLGDTVHWHDHARDMLTLCTHFDIPQPIIAVGHSMGAHQL